MRASPAPTLISFKDGTYGIRRGFKGRYTYLDIKSRGRHWWSDSQSYFHVDCRGTRSVCEQLLHNLGDEGTPVDMSVPEPVVPKEGVFVKLMRWML